MILNKKKRLCSLKFCTIVSATAATIGRQNWDSGLVLPIDATFMGVLVCHFPFDLVNSDFFCGESIDRCLVNSSVVVCFFPRKNTHIGGEKDIVWTRLCCIHGQNTCGKLHTNFGKSALKLFISFLLFSKCALGHSEVAVGPM